MIFLMTIWYPLHKSRELRKIFVKQLAKQQPEYIKKWQIFFTNDGPNGAKAYHLIMVEPGHVDEAAFFINQMNAPMFDVEGFSFKIEPLLGVSDALKIQE